MSEIKDPKNVAPTLGTSPDILVKEFKAIDAQLEEINKMIQLAQNTIREQQAHGQTLIGKLDVVVRILSGMGIDPNTYTPSIEEVLAPQTPDFSGEEEVIEAEVVDIKEDARIKAIKSRLKR